MSEFIKTKQQKDAGDNPYDEHFMVLEITTELSFCVNDNNVHEDDRGYVLFNLEQQGDPANIETYFGMRREMAREFANKILEITK